jgi:hypothetical protein
MLVEPLSKEEQTTLAKLLPRMVWGHMLPELFVAVMGSIISIPIELVVFDDMGNVLMFERHDSQFNGHALPGTVLRCGESVDDAIKRLLPGELGRFEVTYPINLGCLQIRRGAFWGENPLREELAWLHACRARRVPLDSVDWGFFPQKALPRDTLPHHLKLIDHIVARVRSRDDHEWRGLETLLH